MISLDELNATTKRMEMIVKSCDDPAERFLAMNIMNATGRMFQQFTAVSQSPDFKTMVDDFVKSEQEENK